MKRSLLLIMTALAVAVLFAGCEKNSGDEKKDDGDTTETIKVSLSVTNIADNQATVTATLTEGNFYGGMIVEGVKSSSVTIDYTNQIKLINFVKENGVSFDTVPYTGTVTGLYGGDSMFSAVIVYNSEGSAVDSAYQLWTAVGKVWSWSEDNDAGKLGKIEW